MIQKLTSTDIFVDKDNAKYDLYFCLGNLSINAIEIFMTSDRCNKMCKSLGFKKFKHPKDAFSQCHA